MSLQAKKEQIFKHLLVPLGQLLEVLVARYDTIGSPELTSEYQNTRDGVSNKVYSLLGLCSCFIVSTLTTPKQLEAIAQQLDTLHKALYRAAQSGEWAAPSHSCLRQISDLFAASDLTRIIGYADEDRARWLVAVLPTCGPYSKGANSNRWRTFVRHGAWGDAIPGWVPVGFGAEVARLTTRYRSHGDSIASQLIWAEVFQACEATADEPALPFKVLPKGVEVSNGAHGGILVVAKFDPTQELSESQRIQLKSCPLSLETRAILEARAWFRECGTLTIVQTLDVAQTWLQEQIAGTPSVLHTIEVCLAEAVRERVKSKLAKANLTRQELAIAVELLQNDAASTVVALA